MKMLLGLTRSLIVVSMILFSGCASLSKEAGKAVGKEVGEDVTRMIDDVFEKRLPQKVKEVVASIMFSLSPYILGGGGSILGIWGLQKKRSERRRKEFMNEDGRSSKDA